MSPSPRRLLITVPAGILFGVLMALASGNWGLVGVGLMMGAGTGLAWSAMSSARPTPSATGDSMDS